MDTYLNQISADPDFPTFVPCCGYYQHLGSPNPDTVYRRAPVDATGTYRVTGEIGTARQVTIMPFTARMGSSEPFDLAELTPGPDGRFDVLVSPERPVGHTGDWWQLGPDTASLWLRVVSDDWGNEREPRVAIRRVDAPSRRPRPAPEPIEAKVAMLGAIVEQTIGYGVRHTDELIADGFVNQLKLVDYGPQGGMPLQWYHEGVFELDDGEGLLLEAAMPTGCDYFSFSLTDRMFVTLDWVHAPTTLNRTQAGLDDDGVLRVVVAHATIPASGTGWTRPATGAASSSAGGSGRSTRPYSRRASSRSTSWRTRCQGQFGVSADERERELDALPGRGPTAVVVVMQLGVMIAPQQGASYDDQLRAARATEAAGFSDFVRSDHYLAFDSVGLPGPTDSWITLAGLARETERVRLGTMVSAATFRLPGPLAITVAAGRRDERRAASLSPSAPGGPSRSTVRTGSRSRRHASASTASRSSSRSSPASGKRRSARRSRSTACTSN